MTHPRSTAALLAIPVLALAACGSSDKKKSDSTAASTSTPAAKAPAPAGGAASSLTVAADPSGALKFDNTSLSAKAGQVTIAMDNPSQVPHAIAVEGKGIDEKGETVQQGGKSTLKLDLKPGKYSFYCPVGGHEAAGMTGTLTVN